MRRLSPFLAAALLSGSLLIACQPQAPDGQPAAAPADAPRDADAVSATPAGPSVSDFSGPIMARGTEPFWALKIDGTALVLERMGESPVAYQAPGAAISAGRAAWEAKGADGRTMALTLYISECSDGMSDLRYPMTAEVELGTGETLRGCAAKGGDLPREGGPAS